MEERYNAKKLTDGFENEIYNKAIDLQTDYTELALDSITNNEILKEIPIVKTLAAFYNVASSLKARHDVKKILVSTDIRKGWDGIFHDFEGVINRGVSGSNFFRIYLDLFC